MSALESLYIGKHDIDDPEYNPPAVFENGKLAHVGTVELGGERARLDRRVRWLLTAAPRPIGLRHDRRDHVPRRA